MSLNREFRLRGASLLHRQCGLWGHDVRREVNGRRQNLLLELGFSRVPPPDGIIGATGYHWVNGNIRVRLWGFGLHLREGEHAIFLSRFAFTPIYGTVAEDWSAFTPAQVLEKHKKPVGVSQCLATLSLMQRALEWIASYERDVVAHSGESYRATVLQMWDRNSAKYHPIAADWEEVAGNLHQNTHLFIRQDGRRQYLPLALTANNSG